MTLKTEWKEKGSLRKVVFYLPNRLGFPNPAFKIEVRLLENGVLCT